MNKKWKKHGIIAVIMVCIVIAASLSVGIYAIWQKQSEAGTELEPPFDKTDPSWDYIIFSPIDDNGVFVSEDMATAYAAVGYTGLVSQVSIPETHNEKPVTRIATDPTKEGEIRFSGNPIIRKLTVPSSVVSIGGGCFMSLPLLEWVVFLGTTSITLEEYTFAYCSRLTTVDAERPIGDSGTTFMGTPYNTNPFRIVR